MSYQTFVKSQYASSSIEQILTSPPSVLLGVSDDAAATLAGLRIATVFDLSVATLFDNAARIVASAADPRSVMRRFGRAATSLVDDASLSIQAPELGYEKLQAMTGLGPASVAALAKDLAVTTIRDLALWPPFLAAKAIMIEAYNPSTDGAHDPQMPVELVPGSGEFGTERYLYSSVVMFPGKFEAPPRPLKGVLFDMTASPETGFDTMRYGARLTYAHTWSPVGVAKGHLLHSLPLAPGETTSVAVIDWTNKSSAATQQSLSESERLSSSNDRARTVSQIASSVASEFTKGSSVTVAQSTSVGGSVGGLAGLLFGSVSGSANAQTAVSHSVSTGQRNIATSLQQNIRDSTTQVSSSLRSQRAASVSEVNQAQSETLSTRSVTNYNHMHALTVQYYEMVQVYETETRLERAERCIFLPMSLVDFSDERNIVRYLPILKQVALDTATRTMLEQVGDGGQGAGLQLSFTLGDRLPEDADVLGRSRLTAYRLEAIRNARALAAGGFLEDAQDLDALKVDYRAQLTSVRWSPVRSAPPQTPVVGVDVLLENGTVVPLAQSAEEGADPSTVDPALNAGSPLSLASVVGLSLHVDPGYVPSGWRPFGGPEAVVRLELGLQVAEEARWLDATFSFEGDVTELEGKVAYRLSTPGGLTELGQLLNENRLYYSQQIWMLEDPQVRIMQLAPFRVAVGSGVTVNLIDYLSPQPLQVVGNYLVYRFTYEDDADWLAWVKQHVDPSTAEVDLVPIPTGGVFAEAVLGRANSAEKLDVTRFFDWNDSPPPAPPAIQALKAGTHTPADAPPVGELAKPVVSIQAPLALPDPVSLSALLTAITTSDAFRDMSGLKTTADAANQTLDASSKAATGQLQAAGTALATTLDALADVLAKPKDGKSSMSETGALVNQKAADDKKAEEKKPSGADGGSGTGGSGGRSESDRAKDKLVADALAAQGVLVADASNSIGTGNGSAAFDLLSSALVTEPTFGDVEGFSVLLQLLEDRDLVPALVKRFTTLDKAVDPKVKYAELVATITANAVHLENPNRMLYAAKFVKTGVLPGAAEFPAADVKGIRAEAVKIAAARGLTVAKSVNASASDSIGAIVSACGQLGVTDLDQVSYVLATAHHESAMGKYMTELSTGLSTPTVFTRDAYFFEAIPGKKSSYNTLAGNVPAGTALAAATVISTAADIALWNGTAYPAAAPTAVKVAARSSDFYVYIGRGLVQLTGRANYAKFSKLPALNNDDFEAHPDHVTDPDVAAMIMTLGMRDGMFRASKSLADYVTPTGYDATNARDMINGDKATWGKPIRDLAVAYKAALVQVAKLDESAPIL